MIGIVRKTNHHQGLVRRKTISISESVYITLAEPKLVSLSCLINFFFSYFLILISEFVYLLYSNMCNKVIFKVNKYCVLMNDPL